MLVDLQDGGQVVAPVAVVGSTEDSGHLIVVFVRVPFVHELVGSGDHAQLVCVAELLCDIEPEQETCSSGTLFVPLDVVGVAPN